MGRNRRREKAKPAGRARGNKKSTSTHVPRYTGPMIETTAERRKRLGLAPGRVTSPIVSGRLFVKPESDRPGDRVPRCVVCGGPSVPGDTVCYSHASN